MLKRIALTTDFSERARVAYEAAAALAREHGAAIDLLHEAEPLPPFYYESFSRDFPIHSYYESLATQLDAEASRAPLSGLPVHPRLLSPESDHSTILGFLEDAGVDLLVMATHGHTALAHLLLGSFTEKLARMSSVPVLTYRRRKGSGPFSPPGRVIVPFDFSDNARAVLPLVRWIAAHYEPEITLLNVFPHPADFIFGPLGSGTTSRDLQRAVNEATRRTTARLEEISHSELEGFQIACRVREGTPHREIVAEIEDRNADLVLMATHGWTGVKHLFFGSVAERVLRRASCSVLIARPGEIVAGASQESTT